MMRFGLFMVFYLILFEASSQNAPAIHSQRPRLELGKERFDWLKNNISGGDSGNTYNSFKNSYDNNWITDAQTYLAGSDSTKWNYNWNDNDAHILSQMTAFLLQMGTDAQSKKRCEFIISRYIKFLDGINFDNYSGDTKENLLRENCDYGGILFDWTYDYISQTQRQKFANSLYRVLSYFMNNYILTPSGNSYVSSHNIRNCIVTIHAVLALHGANGLTSSQLGEVESWYQTLWGKWNNGILPAFAYFRDDDGGWNWGAAYAMLNLHYQYQFFDDLYYATGTNLYQERPWIRESINQYWYFFRPDNYTIHLGDAVINLDQANRVMYRHAAEFSDPRSQYLVQVYNQSQYLRNTILVFIKLMYKDFTASYVVHPQPPLNWWADKSGLSVSRTSWDENATMLWFYNAPSKRADHEHRDNNSFVIIKDKPLILDAGYYDAFGTTHYNNYYTRTIAHNSVCVFDGSETYRNFGKIVSNDGGQIESEKLDNLEEVFSESHKRGKWIRFASGVDYAYNVADASASYQSDKLDRFERRLLFHKPNRVIILDHLHLLNINTRERKARYINHFANQPNINGQVTNTKVPNHIITYNGRDYKTTNGKGSVAIRTLLPESTTTTLVGGTGYEYWVNGSNYPPGGNVNFEKEHPGSWRIEVEPTVVSENLIFMHTVKIADNQNPANAGGKLLSTETTLGVDWDNHLYLFEAKGDTASTYYAVNNLTGDRTIKVFALDLKSNSSFGVLVDDVLERVGKTNADGILEITVNLLSGNHTVVVRDTIATDPNPGTDPTPDNPGEDDSGEVKIFPNPTNGIVSVLIEDDTVTDFKVSVFDSNGRKISEYRNQSNKGDMDFSGLSAGVYLLVIHYLGKTIRRKIVLI